ncbi:MAG: FHA domain-containing protein [Chloroflexota bacterium]|nr:FHA domain-containing protein [Anaerolineae bacterium]HMM27437.1 FHA domain-containing protein [Aggregatilineaceae bacterium]
MVKCTLCGFENPDGEATCGNCGSRLGAPEPDAAETRRLDPATLGFQMPNWGTARLGRERQLLLHIRGHARPLVVSVTDQLILGRFDVETQQSPDVGLDDYDAQELGVSRRHAAILVEDNALKVMDLGSANATYMNGQKLIAHQARILRDGDELRLGRLVMRVHFA